MVNDEAAAVGAPRSLDSAAVAFDDQRSVADAGLILAGTSAERLGLERLINRWGRSGPPAGRLSPRAQGDDARQRDPRRGGLDRGL